MLPATILLFSAGGSIPQNATFLITVISNETGDDVVRQVIRREVERILSLDEQFSALTIVNDTFLRFGKLIIT